MQGRISLGVILVAIVLAVLAPLLSPDPTPDANEQFAGLAFAPPLTTVHTLALPTAGGTERVAFVPPFSRTGDTLRYAPPERGSAQANHFPTKAAAPREVILPPNTRLAPASTRRFWLGADAAGRDVLARLLLGLRITLAVGLAAVIVSLLIGGTLGALAGYAGGATDRAVMAAVNVFWALPSLLLVIVLSLVLGRSLLQLFFVIGFTLWPDVARMTRGEVLRLRNLPYVEAGRMLGYSHARLLWRHILPAVVPTLAIISAGNFATAILLESGLSFLGIGVQPPTPSWGSMVKEGYGAILFGSAHIIVAPTVALVVLVLAFISLGNVLSQRINPRLRQRE